MVNKILVTMVVMLTLTLGSFAQALELKLIDRPKDEKNVNSDIDCMVNFCVLAIKPFKMKTFYNRFRHWENAYSWPEFQKINKVGEKEVTKKHTWYQFGPKPTE